jgi:predicted outer membrane protein
MLKNISVPVLVASLLAGSAAIAAGSAVAHDTKSSVNAKAKATVHQPVAQGNSEMSAAKKAAKKTKSTKSAPTKKEI